MDIADATESLSFDSDFLSLGKKDNHAEKHVDLSYFAHKGGMAPGEYAVQVKVNEKLVDEGRMVAFRSWPDHPGKLYARVSAEQLLSWWGIKATRGGDTLLAAEEDIPKKTSADTNVDNDNTAQCEECPDDSSRPEKETYPVGGIVAMVPYAGEEFDFNNHLLSFTVPQAYLGPSSRLRTPSRLWDSGIPALLMNYNYNGSQQSNRTGKTRSDFLSVNGQLNILAWRIRSDLTGHSQQGNGTQWNMSEVYAQRDFSRWGGGQLTLGHTASSGGVDSVSFLGAKVDSDDSMFDPAYIAYTPAITGVADSPSTITVRQYGKVIYQQNVPQGPFSVTDFNRSGSGDVDVEVREADGSVRRFSLARASNGVLMQQGATSYSASAGIAANGQGYVDDRFIQMGGSYGIMANTTLTGGALLSRDYQALAAGTGLYAGALGAFTYTLQGNRADLSVIPGQEGSVTGLNHTFGWSRNFGSTALGISYSLNQTPSARSYSQMLSMRPHKADEPCEKESGTRDSLGISVSRSLGEWGSMSLNGTRSTSWGSSQVQQNATLSYNTSVRDISLGLALGYSTVYGHDAEDNTTEHNGNWHRQNHRSDRSVSLTVSVPLGKWLGTDHISNASYSYTRSGDSASQQSGVSGSVLDGALSYSAAQSLTENRSGSLSLGYGGRYGSLSGGYSYGGGASSLSYGLTGGMALHTHGATLGKSLSLSGGNALIAIPDASGIHVGSAITDWRGYALISGLTPYDRNQISVDMSELPGNMELDESSKNVIPTRGALVSVPFKNHKGYRLLLNLLHRGSTVPFGASAVLKQNDNDVLPVTGIVGDEGQAYMSGMPLKGTVTVSWGESLAEQCTAAYALPEGVEMDKLHTITTQCR